MFVIAGASGHTGSVVASTLLAQGKKVRVIVRDEKKGAAWKQKGAEVAIADLDDAKALTRALEGAEGVWALVPPSYGADDLLAAQAPWSAPGPRRSPRRDRDTSSCCRRSAPS